MRDLGEELGVPWGPEGQLGVLPPPHRRPGRHRGGAGRCRTLHSQAARQGQSQDAVPLLASRDSQGRFLLHGIVEMHAKGCPTFYNLK